MFCYNRSQDLFLGVPFNIASSSLLLMLVAKLVDKIPRYFNMTMGNCHIYKDHYQQVEEQLKRWSFISPILTIPNIKKIDDIKKLTYRDFILSNYNYHPSIKAKMIA